MIDHVPPSEFPTRHYTAVAVPSAFAKVIVEAAAKNGVLFEDQLLSWAQAGAEHARLCGPKTTRTTRRPK